MANTKISQLTALTNPTWNEEFVYALNNANGKVTLDTMKTFVQPDLSWYQEELVSWTNIKTINGQSILWSWNMVISWWGWSWEDNDYDAVVDANWGWDYTTIADAITAWIKRIYIKNWTYTLSSQTLSTWDFKLVWESRNWVVIDVSYWTRSGTIFTLTSDTVSQANSFLFKNLTFNISYSWEYWYFIMFWWMWAWNWFLKMSDCNINVTQATNWCNFYITRWSNNDTLIEWCRIEVYLSTWSFTGVWFTWISRRSTCINSTIVVDASASLAQSITFEWRPDWTYIGCRFLIWVDHKKSWDIAYLWSSYWLMCRYESSSYCNLRIGWIQEDCTFPWGQKDANYDSDLNTAVTWKTITIWKPSTSYSVWQYVQSWYSLWLAKCIEAHTSWTEYDNTKFEEVYWDVYVSWILKNCSLNVWWTVIISWVAQYAEAFTLPSVMWNFESTTFTFTKNSSSLPDYCNIVVLWYKWFNNNGILWNDMAPVHVYLWGEWSTFIWNRIVAYTWSIYSWGYGNIIVWNVFTYVTWQTTPTITQVTSWQSEIANNVIRGVADWTN